MNILVKNHSLIVSFLRMFRIIARSVENNKKSHVNIYLFGKHQAYFNFSFPTVSHQVSFYSNITSTKLVLHLFKDYLLKFLKVRAKKAMPKFNLSTQNYYRLKIFKEGGILPLINFIFKNTNLPLLAKSKFNNIPQDLQINGYDIKVIKDFPTLKKVAGYLRICSSSRPDLVESFFCQELVRFAVTNDFGRVVGVFTIQNKEQPETTDLKKVFKVYGLTYTHRCLRKGLYKFETQERATTHNEVCDVYDKFLKIILSKNITYQNQTLSPQTYWDEV